MHNHRCDSHTELQPRIFCYTCRNLSHCSQRLCIFLRSTAVETDIWFHIGHSYSCLQEHCGNASCSSTADWSRCSPTPRRTLVCYFVSKWSLSSPQPCLPRTGSLTVRLRTVYPERIPEPRRLRRLTSFVTMDLWRVWWKGREWLRIWASCLLPLCPDLLKGSKGCSNEYEQREGCEGVYKTGLLGLNIVILVHCEIKIEYWLATWLLNFVSAVANESSLCLWEL